MSWATTASLPGQTVASPVASSSPQPLSVLEAPPGLRWGELVHIPHLVVGLVAHGEEELVAEANLLLGHRCEGRRVRWGEEAASPHPRAAPVTARPLTFWGLARSRTWVIAVGWTMGLKAGSSVPEGGCSFTFMTCGQDTRCTANSSSLSFSPREPGPASLPALTWGVLGLCPLVAFYLTPTQLPKKTGGGPVPCPLPPDSWLPI